MVSLVVTGILPPQLQHGYGYWKREGEPTPEAEPGYYLHGYYESQPGYYHHGFYQDNYNYSIWILQFKQICKCMKWFINVHCLKLMIKFCCYDTGPLTVFSINTE